MSLKELTKSYDRIAAVRAGIDKELRTDDRKARISAVADALVAGEPLPTSTFDRKRAENDLAGCGLAMQRISYAVAEEIGGDSEHDARLPEQLPPTAELLVAQVHEAFASAQRSHDATAAILDVRHRYEAALEEFNEKRGVLICGGMEPSAASEQAHAEMGSQDADLFPPGSVGESRGEALGTTTVGL